MDAAAGPPPSTTASRPRSLHAAERTRTRVRAARLRLPSRSFARPRACAAACVSVHTRAHACVPVRPRVRVRTRVDGAHVYLSARPGGSAAFALSYCASSRAINAASSIGACGATWPNALRCNALRCNAMRCNVSRDRLQRSGGARSTPRAPIGARYRRAHTRAHGCTRTRAHTRARLRKCNLGGAVDPDKHAVGVERVLEHVVLVVVQVVRDVHERFRRPADGTSAAARSDALGCTALAQRCTGLAQRCTGLAH